MQIEVSHVSINPLAYLIYYARGNAQRHIYAVRYFHRNAVHDTVLAIYSHTCRQFCGLRTLVLECHTSSIAHIVEQAHLEVIPVSTCLVCICLARLYQCSCVAVSLVRCRSISINSLGSQFQSILSFHTYIQVIYISCSENAIIYHMIYAHACWHWHNHWHGQFCWAVY